MAIGDFPRIPKQYNPRLQALAEKLRRQEITVTEVQQEALQLLGRARISADGVCFSGEFGSFVLDREGLKAGLEVLKTAVSWWPALHGRELLVQKGGQVTRWRLGRLPKKIEADLAEVDNTLLPVIILPSSAGKGSGRAKLPRWVKFLLDDPNGLVSGGNGSSGAPAVSLKICRIEELLGWFEDWPQLAQFLALGIPAVPLTQKKRLDKLGESLPAFIDAWLAKCGV